MIDPVSGTPVPPGALPQEVRDDVPINASEGEYVLPANVVRYIGLDKIEKMVNQAEKGIAQMQEGGRIGGEPPMPAAPQEPMMEAPMFNKGGLITDEDRKFTDTTRNYPAINFNNSLDFSPRRFIEGSGQGRGSSQQRVQKFVGPDGRVLYIPINSAGQLIFAPPEGFTRADQPPVTQAQAVAETKASPTTSVQQDPGGGAMWSDGLTGAQIREEQANRTFRTYDELNPNVGSGQLPGFLGDLMSGITDRISSAMERLTSGEALGAIAQAALTLAGQPILGKVVGVAVDKFNEKRKQEGLPEMTVEQVTAQISTVAPLSQAQVIEIANNAVNSPSNVRVSDAATQEGALDLDSYTVLGQMGTPEDPSFMVRGPDGSIMTVKPGDEIDGVTFGGLQAGVGDPVGRRLSDVAILSGSLPGTTPFKSGISPTDSALGAYKYWVWFYRGFYLITHPYNKCL
jgi:hypothetical protein